MYLFDCSRSSLHHTGSLVAACRIYFLDKGSNQGPLHWEHRVLATGPQGKSLVMLLMKLSSQHLTESGKDEKPVTAKGMDWLVHTWVQR